MIFNIVFIVWAVVFGLYSMVLLFNELDSDQYERNAFISLIGMTGMAIMEKIWG